MNISKKMSIEEQITFLEAILKQLEHEKTMKGKLAVLNGTESVKCGLSDDLKAFFEGFSDEINLLFKTMIVIGQGSVLFSLLQDKKAIPEKLIHVLKEIDDFYESSSGLILYQLSVLKLILENSEVELGKKIVDASVNYLKPVGMDLSIDSKSSRQMIRQGIENLSSLAEIYPVGGAGERLKLCDPINHEPLPVACLPFLGRSLLEGLIRDLEAREFLYYKLTGERLITPVAMMTSEENGNHTHIEALCQKNNWFNRSKENFFLFSQPMVPVNTIEGNWLLASTDELMLKPSGHGVIWKLSSEKKVLDWFKKKKRKKLLSRQINNPIAGVDSGLLGFTGVGFHGHYLFGFSSCDRYLNTSEGMDILIEKKTEEGFEYKITNIEYTELLKNGIDDCPEVAGGQFSKFPANTNILFLDVENIEKVIQSSPVPGMLINMKTEVPYVDERGLLKKMKAGRLESTMQNAADVIVNKFTEKLETAKYANLSSYLTYNKRNKTISVTKKSLIDKNSFSETPESCFYDICKNNHEFFSIDCKMELPDMATVEEYLMSGPSVLITYHPALGPLYSVIAQKVRKGKFSKHAELQLEIAEVDIEGLELDGSLIVEAENVTVGKCTLKNVKVKNRGIDRQAENQYWKQEIKRFEVCKIKIHGNGELIAENLTIESNLEVEVMDGERLIISPNEGKLQFKREKIDRLKEYWHYTFDHEDRIILTKN